MSFATFKVELLGALVAAGLLAGCSGLASAKPKPLTPDPAASAGIGADRRLPTAAEVPLNLPDWSSPADRRRAAEIYDYVRTELIRARVDYRTAVLILSTVTKNREADFLTPEQFALFGPGEARPSLSEQFRWRAAMMAIAQSTLARFYTAPAVQAGKDEPITLHEGPWADGRVLSLLTSALQRAFEGFETVDFAVGTEPVRGIAGPFKWRSPIRVAATGVAGIDRIISSTLARIHREVPSAPIDRRSFPASKGSANVFVRRERDSGWFDLRLALGDCLVAQNCLNVRQIMTGQQGGPFPAETRAFLARAYLTRPYRGRLSDPVALLEVTRDGGISAAICGSDDGVTESEQAILLTSCLAQALGAFPVSVRDRNGFDREFEASLIAREMDELRELYD